MDAPRSTAGLAVRVDAVVFSYGEGEVHFDATFEAETITAVMGPSGAGKTTLINLIAGFETPSKGRIVVGETDVTRMPPSERPMSVIFQENNLFPHLDVVANVGLGISPALRLAADDRERIAVALGRVGLAGKERRLPAELSGGERQRVAIARALVRDRPVLLLDEPFASLGPALRAEMLDLLREVQGERRMTVILVSHQPDDAHRVASRVVFLDEGSVAASGSVDRILGSEAPTAVRRYVGKLGRRT